MADNIERKRVTLHPLKTDGTIDENVNLYPKTFLDGIVDRDGNEVDVATQQELDTQVQRLEQEIQDVPKGDVTHQQLNNAITTLQQEINNIPPANDGILTIQKNGTKLGDFSADSKNNKTINIIVPVNANDVNALPNTTKYGSALEVTLNPDTYVLSAKLRDQDGTVMGTEQQIDLPLESVIVDGSYDSATKCLVLVLKSGEEIEIPVGDLVEGLQPEIDENNPLPADYVTDDGQAHKFVSVAEKTTWTGKQDQLVSGINIKTINNESILGEGNLSVSGDFATDDEVYLIMGMADLDDEEIEGNTMILSEYDSVYDETADLDNVLDLA